MISLCIGAGSSSRATLNGITLSNSHDVGVRDGGKPIPSRFFSLSLLDILPMLVKSASA